MTSFGNSIGKNAEPVVNVNDVSRISEGTVVKGDMSSEGDVRVDGCVNGTLYSKGRVVVGECASLTGSLLATNVDFWGKMEGDIYVKDLLTLKSTSVVNGSIHVRKLQVEMGAQINGTCKMITEAEYDKSCASVVTTGLKSDNAASLPAGQASGKAGSAQ